MNDKPTIIVEGVDLSGKDTLCLKLAEKYGLDFVHMTNHDPKDYEFYSQSIRKKGIVYSRNFISELIYSKIFGRQCELSYIEVTELLEQASANGVRFLILTADDEELQKRLAERGEQYSQVADNLSGINSQFITYATHLNIPLIDTSKMSFENICKVYID